MADGVLGLAGGGSAALSQEVIDKLKAAERVAQVEPIETDVTNYDLATEKVDAIEAKVLELLASVKTLDLFNSTGTNVFDQMAATTTGTAATFEALDSGSLDPGTVTVVVTQLAQKDVYEGSTFTDASAQVSGGNDSGDMITLSQTDRPVYQSDNTTTAPSTDIVDATGGTITLDGSNDFVVTSTMTYTELNDLINAHASYSSQIINDRLSITNADGTSTVAITDSVGSVSTTIGLSLGEKYTTESKTYTELAADINTNSNYAASVEQVGTSSYRLVLKSSDTGTENAITISETGVSLGFASTLTAQNAQATIDGVNYDVASNTINTQGNLNVTAAEVGTSTISITRDTGAILTNAETMVTKYNELLALVNAEVFDSSSPVEDMTYFQSMMSEIKTMLFANYGTSDDKNLFDYGFDLDKEGNLSVNTADFATAVSTDFDGLKELFVGVAEDKGLGTQMKEYIDDIFSYDGLLYTYDNNRIERKATLDEDLATAIEELDDKYDFLAEQFAEYGKAIAAMEASFSGLQLMIEQSVASS